MKLFINDKPVSIVKLDAPVHKDYDVVLKRDEDITSKKLLGDVLIYDAKAAQIDRLIKILENKKLKELWSITFAVRDKGLMKDYVKDNFKIIKAAGGIVRKGDKVLMIFRLGKWDLPKGKLNKHEDPAEGALREVEEECNIKVSLDKKIGSTWHSYIRKGKRILKKTYWYEMTCVSDDDMAPQTEEFIEEVVWMSNKEVKSALKNTYKSIEEIVKVYNKTPQSL
ncbi:NUDIX domain-containing protein [Cytophagaceae bacterium ABcell3]|nr:NUDIX domain-containing protein [Cytophagaceae bacterium ABcell3]